MPKPVSLPPGDPLPERFVERVDVDESGCWIWTGNTWENGYGRVWHEGAMWRAHRLSYTLLVGPIPAGLVMDHLCHRIACVNPAHLEPVTLHENAWRRKGADRDNQLGIRGVVKTGNSYVASVTWRGVTHRVGSYPTERQAEVAAEAFRRGVEVGSA